MGEVDVWLERARLVGVEGGECLCVLGVGVGVGVGVGGGWG